MAEDGQFSSSQTGLLPNVSVLPTPLVIAEVPLSWAYLRYSGTSGFLFSHQLLSDRTGLMGEVVVASSRTFDETLEIAAVGGILLNLLRTGSTRYPPYVGMDMRGRGLPVSEGRCDHVYPVLVTPTEDGSCYATCLACLTSGPPRSSSRAAHQALKEGVERLHQSSRPHLFGL